MCRVAMWAKPNDRSPLPLSPWGGRDGPTHYTVWPVRDEPRRRHDPLTLLRPGRWWHLPCSRFSLILIGHPMRLTIISDIHGNAEAVNS